MVMVVIRLPGVNDKAVRREIAQEWPYMVTTDAVRDCGTTTLISGQRATSATLVSAPHAQIVGARWHTTRDRDVLCSAQRIFDPINASAAYSRGKARRITPVQTD